jgi:DNA adenine methylase
MEITDKIQKSVLRYPGGKSRAVEFILKLIPSDTEEIVSPFFGGGSIELACDSLGIKVTGYDIFDPLVDFWQCAIKDPIKLAKIVKQYHPLSKKDFYKLQKEQFTKKDEWDIAAIFFVLNRSSFSGSTLSGGMSPDHPRFNESSIERLRQFKTNNCSVCKLSFTESIKKHKKEFLYLDPPYLIKNNLYGNNGDAHKNFDHIGLFGLIKDRPNWILSYNNCPEIIEMYRDFQIIYPKWKYGMSKNKDSNEVIILSKNLKIKI